MRKHKLALGVVILLGGLGGALGGTAFLVKPPKVPPEVIEASITRPQALLDRAWALPVAATFKGHLTWQSNPSACGLAGLANVFRSLGEPADTEAEVVKGAGPCWFGICPIGLTLDELGALAQAHTGRRVTVIRDLTLDAFRDEGRAMIRAVATSSTSAARPSLTLVSVITPPLGATWRRRTLSSCST